MSNYIPIGQYQVTNYIDAKAQIDAAARELFYAYTEVFPDRDEWHGRYAWQGTCGEITIGAESIEYRKEVYHRGDSDCYTLTLPLSALYDPNFLADEQARWTATKEKSAAFKLQEEETTKQKKLESDRKMYEHLMKHFDPEIYERMKQTENQS